METKDKNRIFQNLEKYKSLKKSIPENYLLPILKKINKYQGNDSLHILNMLYYNMEIFLNPLNDSIATIRDNIVNLNKLDRKVHNLFGSIDQCLHTLSEIGLAKYFADKNYLIDFDYKYNDHHEKDIDIVASNGNETLFIEIINLGKNNCSEISPFGSLESLDKKFYDKIIRKIKTKKFNSNTNNIDGKLFIAIDWIKDDSIAINTFHNQFIKGDIEFKEIANKIIKKKDYIHGIIFYTHYPNNGVLNFFRYE